jgi:hypothetical protein
MRHFIFKVRQYLLKSIKSDLVSSRALYTFEFNKILSHFKNKMSHLLYHLEVKKEQNRTEWPLFAYSFSTKGIFNVQLA